MNRFIRSYWLTAETVTKQRATEIWDASHSGIVARELSIKPFIVTPSSLPTEAVLIMTPEQHALWRLADGDLWSASGISLAAGAQKTPAEVLAERIWEVIEDFGYRQVNRDRALSFWRGDRMISVYESGLIRGVKLLPGDNIFYKTFYDDNSQNMRSHLESKFGFDHIETRSPIKV